MRKEVENRQEATLVDWSFVLFPLVKFVEPSVPFSDPDCNFLDTVFVDPSLPHSTTCIFGRALNDPRSDGVGFFINGNRISTSRVLEIKNGVASTKNINYTLKADEINDKYKYWCKTHGVNLHGFENLNIKFESQNK